MKSLTSVVVWHCHRGSGRFFSHDVDVALKSADRKHSPLFGVESLTSFSTELRRKRDDYTNVKAKAKPTILVTLVTSYNWVSVDSDLTIAYQTDSSRHVLIHLSKTRVSSFFAMKFIMLTRRFLSLIPPNRLRTIQIPMTVKVFRRRFLRDVISPPFLLKISWSERKTSNICRGWICVSKERTNP